MVDTRNKREYTLLKDVQEDKSLLMLKWYRHVLRITAEHTEVTHIESGRRVSSKKYYEALFDHIEEKIYELTRLLDVNIFDAWKILQQHQSMSFVDECDLEGCETFEDFNVKAEFRKFTLNDKTFFDNDFIN